MTQPLHRRQLPEHPIVNRRLDNLERRSLTQQSNLSIPRTNAGGHFATRLVASSMATDEEKSGADYVCDGVDDNLEIQAALDDCNGAFEGGDVRLSGGDFSLSAFVSMGNRWVSMHGAGWLATLLYHSGPAFSGPIIEMRGGHLEDLWISDPTSTATISGIDMVSGGVLQRVRFDVAGDGIRVFGGPATIRDIDLDLAGLVGIHLIQGRYCDIGHILLGASDTAPAIKLTKSGTTGCDYNRIHDCYFELVNGGAIESNGGNGHNMVRDCKVLQFGTSAVAHAMELTGDRNSISGCDFEVVPGGAFAPVAVSIAATSIDEVVAYNIFRGYAGTEITDAGAGSVTTPNVII